VDLVDATVVVPDLILDLRYASTKNFLGKQLYPAARCLLRIPAAEQLKKAALWLRERGYRVVVWDCYRPHRVQKVMWAAHPVRGYVAPPQPGSVHNRGGAVDVSLALLDGSPLRMPTDFDDFSTRANLHSTDHPADVMERRQLLRDGFERAGFTGIRSEWWHFEATHARGWPVLDVPLDTSLPAAKNTPP
jgi:D-alanyl-D-alanine dipeptidase